MTATDSLLALEPEKVSAPSSRSLSEGNKWWAVTKAVLLRLLTMVLSIALDPRGVAALPRDLRHRSLHRPGPARRLGLPHHRTGRRRRPRPACGRPRSPRSPTPGSASSPARRSRCLCALVFNLAPSTEATFMPIAIVLRSVPLVAMTPLIILIFGRGLLGVTVIAGIVTFFPVLVNVSLALRSAPQAAIDLCHAYGADAATDAAQGAGSHRAPGVVRVDAHRRTAGAGRRAARRVALDRPGARLPDAAVRLAVELQPALVGDRRW